MLGQSEKSKLRKRLGALMVGAGTVIALPLTATVTYAEVEAEEAHPHEGLEIASGGVTVDVGRNGVVVANKSEDGYDYTVKNKHGSFQFQSDRKLSDKQIAKRVRHLDASSPEAVTLAIAPPMPPETPSNPQAARFLSITSGSDTINITMLDGDKKHGSSGEYTHRIRHNGKTIILNTNKKLSEDEIQEMVEEAQKSRRQADEAAREHRLSRNERRRDMHEAERERRDAEREVERSLKEAEREIRNAEREARRATRKEVQSSRQTSSVWSIANQISEISFAPRAPRAPQPPRALTPTKATLFAIRNVSCNTISKDLPFHNGQGVLIERAWATVVDCSGYEPKKNRKKLLKMTLQVLLKSRSAAASCKKPDTGHAKKMQSFDRAIQHLQKKIATA